MREFFKRPPTKRAEPKALPYADGRAFSPVNVEDGNPRIVITADASAPLPDGGLPIHVDYWNGVTWENAGEMLLLAQRVVTEHALQGRAKGGDT